MLSSTIAAGAGTLEELLSYQNDRFVTNAYQVLLGRKPDPEGMKYYLDRLRKGINKIEILAQLRNGKEGQSKRVRIKGLNEAIRRHKQLKTPVLGSLLRLAGVRQIGEESTGFAPSGQEISPGLADLLEQHGLKGGDFPNALTLETVHGLNPNERFDDIDQAISILFDQSPVRKLRVYSDDRSNARFYAQLAANQEVLGIPAKAIELYRLSLLFANTPGAHEHLANLALEAGRYRQALGHYQMSIDQGSKSRWVYVNLARVYALLGNHEAAVRTICAGIKNYPSADMLMSRLDGHIEAYWALEEQTLECLAAAQDREELIARYDAVTRFICDAYNQVFMRNSSIPAIGGLNTKRVLIIGLTKDAAPQCYRYRIEQKLEQLEWANYKAETIAWHDHERALGLIANYDLIIFYRAPAFPGVLKLVEYAKALGKVTFYELDDLLFEPVGVPPLETYGGQVSLEIYTSITKDIGSHRAIASRCDFAIASTVPLLEKLAPLTLRKTGYLHRNGLDKYNRLTRNRPAKKGYINLFYGSGTLAHNSDFIVEALPAITRVLKEQENVKLTIVGYLTLPGPFLREFGGRVIQLPLLKDIGAYWAYLSASDINLAVLHDDELTACKSELKWFEAATFSIPSVVSRTQNYLDVIRDGEDGFVVAGEDQWYSVLTKLVKNSELRKEIGENAHKRVEAEYSIQALANNIDQIVKRAVSQYFHVGGTGTKAEFLG